MENEKNPWTILGSKELYDNNWIKVTEYDVINPNGGKGIYGKVHFKNIAIGVVPLDEDMNIYLVGQYRFPLDQYTWEIPEGGCPIGSDPLDSAKRELIEETGLVAKEWTYLLKLHLSNCVCDEYSLIYLARNLEQQTATPDETEKIVVKKVPFEEALKMIDSEQITDSVTIAAIQKIKLMMLEQKLPGLPRPH